MFLSKTSLPKNLLRLRQRQISEIDFMKQVFEALDHVPDSLGKIQHRISTDGPQDNVFELELLETDRIFHLKQIRELCIIYRLRFLDSKYFKGALPPQALYEIEKLQKCHNSELRGFKIMAPSRLFKLEDKDDPMLFAPMGNDYYYLIHHWGKDLHPLRKLLVWPFRNIGNLTLVVLLISLFTTLLIPDGLFSKNGSKAEFWLIFFFVFKAIGAVVIFYGFALGKNFNPEIWNSKYYNA